MVLGGIGSYFSKSFGGASAAVLQQEQDRESGKRTHKDEALGVRDVVELSAHAPRPIDARSFEQADAIASRLSADEPLTSADQKFLRKDRVHAAVATLSLLVKKGIENPSWPGGLPRPTPAELEEAYRRINQRLEDLAAAQEPEKTQVARYGIIDAFRNVKLSTLSFADEDDLAA